MKDSFFSKTSRANSRNQPINQSGRWLRAGNRVVVAPFEPDFAGEFGEANYELAAEVWESEVNRSSSGYVRWVQESLNRILGLKLAVDGDAGVKTRSAIRSFQTQRGLVADGLVGSNTEAALLAAGAGPVPGSSGTSVTPSPNQITPVVTPVCPRGLICLEHFHIPKLPDPRMPGQFVTGALTRLAAQNMNPGFIDTADHLVTNRSNTGLQTCLMKLLTTQFQNYLSRESIQQNSASGNDRVRVGLVDLTGAKLTQPDFAGWGSPVSMYGASVPKILALYAAFQLRKDLRNLAATLNISAGQTLESAAISSWKVSGLRTGFPQLIWLFDIRNWSGNPNTLDFTAAARNVFQNIMHNAEAGELIIKVGFPYIASVTWQSGLHHPNRGGLWLSSSYGKGEWGSNPLTGVFSANATALSVATYFTLLAQGRLVDDVSSNEMKTWLRGGCFTGLFPQNLGLVASKCGIWSDYLHDCALIVRGSIRYIVVGLTRTKPNEFPKYTQLFLELDKLIVRNNQTPKPMC